MLNNIVTTLNNVVSKILLNAVFIRPEQVVRFLLCNREDAAYLIVREREVNHSYMKNAVFFQI